jgi:hypothetical protein
MANKIKIVVSLLLAVSLGAIVHSFTSIPKGYAVPQSQSTFKQVLLQSKDKPGSVIYIYSGDALIVSQGKIINLGDDFMEVSKPNRSSSDILHTCYIPFTSMQRVEKIGQSINIWLQ